jgi:hypothetical protein
VATIPFRDTVIERDCARSSCAASGFEIVSATHKTAAA